jgi:hypothetical protein
MPTPIMPSVKVEIKDVYGVRTVYPVCENARTFAAIAGTKTLTKDTIRHIKDLGFAVVLVQPELEI